MGGVAALIGEALHLTRRHGAVGSYPRDDMEADSMTHTVGHKGLLTGAVHTDAAPAHLRGAPSAQRLIERILLVAEAAADVGLDNADVGPRTAQRLTYHTANDVGDLGRGHHRHATVLLVCKAAEVLNVAVLHTGRIVPALHPNEAGLCDSGGVIALAHIGVL